MYDQTYYQRPALVEGMYERAGLLRPDQYAAACFLYGLPLDDPDTVVVRVDRRPVLRKPGRIVSIGCGEGILEAWLEQCGHEVVGVDPSPGARALYRGSRLVAGYDGTGNTVLFVESMEHLPESVLDDIWQRIPVGARIIVTNWRRRHPIEPDGSGWDHVTLVHDALYDRLSVGHEVVVRDGAYLVLDRVEEWTWRTSM